MDSSVGLEQTSYSEDPTDLTMRIFPNPSNQKANLEVIAPKAEMGLIRVFDIKGTLRYRQEVVLTPGQQLISIDCSSWPPGIFLFQLIVGDKTWSEELIISR